MEQHCLVSRLLHHTGTAWWCNAFYVCVNFALDCEGRSQWVILHSGWRTAGKRSKRWGTWGAWLRQGKSLGSLSGAATPPRLLILSTPARPRRVPPVGRPAECARGGTSGPTSAARRKPGSGSDRSRNDRHLGPCWASLGPVAAPRRGTGRPGRDGRAGTPRAGEGRAGLVIGGTRPSLIGGRGTGQSSEGSGKGLASEALGDPEAEEAGTGGLRVTPGRDASRRQRLPCVRGVSWDLADGEGGTRWPRVASRGRIERRGGSALQGS